MGAPARCWGRDQNCSTLNHRDPIFYLSDSGFPFDFHVSKKRKISGSSRGVGYLLSGYPEPTPFKREVHAPCRTFRYRCPGSANERARSRIVETKGLDNSMGNFLQSQYNLITSRALGCLRIFRKKKGIVDAVTEPESNMGCDNSSIEESPIEEFEREVEGDSVVSNPKSLENSGIMQNMCKPGLKISEGECGPSSVVTELMNDNLGVDNTKNMLESLSLTSEERLPVYEKLRKSAEKRNTKLSDLKFQIELNESRRSSLQLLHPKKKPVAEDKLQVVFAPLTEEEKDEVSKAFHANWKSVLVTHENSNIAITTQMFHCLKPGAWLNDEVINVYLELLKEREKREPTKFLKCHFFSTFFYKKLIGGKCGYDFKSVRRWTTQRKLGYSLIECDKIFVPIHKEIHWCLAVINQKDEKFQYLDSLKGVDSRVLKVLAKYIVDEVKDKCRENIDVSGWMHEYVEDLPAQENGSDCGMFMIKYADFYSRGMDLCFKQENMPYFRLRTGKEILRLRAE